MKKILSLILIVAVAGSFSCVKEPAPDVSADFTTNLVNNTLKMKQDFVVYLHNVEGDFITYFDGSSPTKVYSDTLLNASGRAIDANLDSAVVRGYRSPGEYEFTLVVSSYGNWGEDLNRDSKSIMITVIDEEYEEE